MLTHLGTLNQGQRKVSRNPNQHYNCMELKDICDLPVKDIAADNSVLLMWVIDPMLDLAFDVIEASKVFNTRP